MRSRRYHHLRHNEGGIHPLKSQLKPLDKGVGRPRRAAGGKDKGNKLIPFRFDFFGAYGKMNV